MEIQSMVWWDISLLTLQLEWIFWHTVGINILLTLGMYIFCFVFNCTSWEINGAIPGKNYILPDKWNLREDWMIHWNWNDLRGKNPLILSLLNAFLNSGNRGVSHSGSMLGSSCFFLFSFCLFWWWSTAAVQLCFQMKTLWFYIDHKVIQWNNQ